MVIDPKILATLEQIYRRSNKSCLLESRPVCVQDGLNCLRVYEVVLVAAQETTVLRVETHSGTVLESPTFVPCNCDCVDEPGV